MARIRIVDDWLRSPASQPTHYRSIMVVADSWAEQRVLMRAYAQSGDQTRPTIVLHGQELAIGPAGTDPHESWGIHVQPPVDGRAQELKDQLELAARRMSGSKGNPARLADEQAPFERKRTNNWAPGAPRDVPGGPPQGYYEPQVAASQSAAAAIAASHHAAQVIAPPDDPVSPYSAAPPSAPTMFVPPAQTAQFVPPAQPAQFVPQAPPAQFVPQAAAPVNPGERKTPMPVQAPGRRRGWTSPIPIAASAAATPARTALGYDSGAGAQSAVVRLGLRPAVSARLARLVDRTVPADFTITPHERDVINALGEREQLTARQIGQMIGVADPVTWMERLVLKLASYGLDLVAPGAPAGGEPTYVLRR
jgi:hypothetical protein